MCVPTSKLILTRNISSIRQHYNVLLTSKHIDVCTVRDGENMGWHFATSFASIKFRASKSVYGESSVGVDGYTEEARVGLKTITSALSR